MTATERAAVRLIDQLSPLDDWVFSTNIRRHGRIGSLYVPDSNREDLQFGEVLAVGRGERRENGKRMPMTVKVGDKILWAKHWEKPVDFSREEKYAAVRERDIIGILLKNIEGGETVQPLYNTIIVEMDPLEDKVGSLYLPQQVKRPLMPAMHGTVIDCGPGHRMKDGSILPLEVRPGSRVVCEAYGGEDHPFGSHGAPVRLIPEEHVLAVLD